MVEEKEEPDVEAQPTTDPAEVSGETAGEESEAKEQEPETEADQTAVTEEGETTEAVWQLLSNFG